MNDLSDPSDLPQEFGDYVLLRCLGRGGMGQVYLAKVRSKGLVGVDKMCVVKTLRVTNDPEYQRRFVDEARLIVLLTHRNICHVFDAGCFEGQYYLAMEHINGRELRAVQKLSEDHELPLPADVAIFAIKEVLEALDAAHRMTHPISGEPLRVVHRDVSPQNVMLSGEGEVKLIDFGLAESSQKLERTAPRIVMGKIAYMAPEQARGDPGLDGRADQFAAGVLLYELLANERYYGALPFDDVWRTSGRGGFRPHGLDRIEPALVAVIQKATSASREDRYASCGDMRAALQKVELQRGVLAGSREVRTALQTLLDRAGEALPSMSSPEIKALAGQAEAQARARARAAEEAAQLLAAHAAAARAEAKARARASLDDDEPITLSSGSQGPSTTVEGAILGDGPGLPLQGRSGPGAPRERTRTFRVRSVSSSDNPPTSIQSLGHNEKTEIGFVIEGLEPQELPPALGTGDAFRPVSLLANEHSSSLSRGPMPPPIGAGGVVSAETPTVPPSITPSFPAVREPTMLVRPRGPRTPPPDLAPIADVRPPVGFDPPAPARALPLRLLAAAGALAVVALVVVVASTGGDDPVDAVDAGATLVGTLPERPVLPVAVVAVADAGALGVVVADADAGFAALLADAGVAAVVDAGAPRIEPLEPVDPGKPRERDRDRVRTPRAPARDIPPLPPSTAENTIARTKHLRAHCGDVACVNDVLIAQKDASVLPAVLQSQQDACFRRCLKKPKK